MGTHLNVEIKARCVETAAVLQRLASLGGQTQGVDTQIDTYFRAASGRLKLRQGVIENHLIHYERIAQTGPKESVVALHPVLPEQSAGLRDLLASALGIAVVVSKRRHILWIDNVKFHVDTVEDLGAFVEVEAIDRLSDLGAARLREQCVRYVALLGIEEGDLEARSYSDLLAASG